MTLWALTSTHEHSKAIICAHEHWWSWCQSALSTHEGLWCKGNILIYSQMWIEVSVNAMSAYYCSWVLMSIDEYSWACFHVTVSTHESSWAVMSIVPCGNEHSLALMGTIGDIALYLWMLMSAHRRKKVIKRAPKSSWEFISVEVLHPKINKKC